MELNKRCPKCGDIHPAIEHKKSFILALGKNKPEHVQDYLKLTCTECSYTWDLDPLDRLDGEKK